MHFGVINYPKEAKPYMKIKYKQLRPYLLLWSTQSFSALGSSMTSYALVLWLYIHSGSALKTAMLSVCSYAPYVIMSIFAGALSDKWNKKYTMLVCDLMAAVTTVVIFILVKTGSLCEWHLYLLNAINGLMNTVQQPASEVAATLLIPKEYYQKTSGLRSFSQSLNTILVPVLATVLFSFAGIWIVIVFDLVTFIIAFMALSLFIHIPEGRSGSQEGETILKSAGEGIKWLKQNTLVLNLIMFLACINFVASAYDAVLPAMLLPKYNGDGMVLGMVNTCAGIAALAGSVFVTVMPAPGNRVKAICIALIISMSTENFLLAFGRTPVVWCIGAVAGWLPIPFMNANMDVVFRSTIPPDMQGRVYSCRNTFQFFTIPAGFLAGGFLTDNVFVPLMERQPGEGVLSLFFGTGKGAGAAMLFSFLGVAGTAVCITFSLVLRKYKWYSTE